MKFFSQYSVFFSISIFSVINKDKLLQILLHNWYNLLLWHETWIVTATQCLYCDVLSFTSDELKINPNIKLIILSNRDNFFDNLFFSLGVFFGLTFMDHRTAEKKGGHFKLFTNISTYFSSNAENSPLHPSDCTQTGNLWFLSASP